MPTGYLRSECRICERSTDEVGRLSARGKCAECGNRRLVENHEAMLARRGPFFDHWRRRTLAAFGVGLADEPRDSLDSDRDAA